MRRFHVCKWEGSFANISANAITKLGAGNVFPEMGVPIACLHLVVRACVIMCVPAKEVFSRGVAAKQVC